MAIIVDRPIASTIAATGPEKGFIGYNLEYKLVYKAQSLIEGESGGYRYRPLRQDNLTQAP
jgi:hypothetical protein